MEYTEGGTTTLKSYPGGAAPAATARVAERTFGITRVEAYQVPTAMLGAWVGATRNTDHLVLHNNRLKLTNDVNTAEWVIAGHEADAPARELIAQTLRDIASLYRFRSDLKAFIDANTIAGHTTVIAPDGHNDLGNPGPQGLFVYRPDDRAVGKVQITATYANVETIRRINQLNASKFLTGTKVPHGQDAARVASDPGWLETTLGGWNASSSATAAALLADLLGQSADLTAGGATLTAAQVALIKLMVVNDAMASNMSRHQGIIGQAQEKNIQRFFPKAERQNYVNAVARADVPAALMTALRAHIVGSQATMAQAVWNRADPFALTLEESIRERVVLDATTATAAGATNMAAATAAATVAAGVPAATVTAAIAAVGTRIARALADGMTRERLIPAAAALIGGTVADAAAATAIATAVVTAAVAARDNVTVAVMPLLAARRENAAGRATAGTDRDAIKNLVLGVNGASLAGWIVRASHAYTDATGTAAHHINAGGTGNVIRSTQGYTPLAAGSRGAIYEFREREVDMSAEDQTAITAALTTLFGAIG